MKKNAVLITIFIVCILPAHAQISTQPKKLDRILEKLSERYDKIECFSCSFRRKQKIIQLEGELQYSGKLYFKKPHYINMELVGEENLKIYCNGEKIWIEDLDFDEVEILDFQEFGSNKRLSQLLPPIFFQTIDELKEKFKISLIRSEDGKDRLEIQPHQKGMVSFESFQFDVGSWDKITWLKVIYKNGDYTETEFRDWKTHPEISDNFFSVPKIQP